MNFLIAVVVLTGFLHMHDAWLPPPTRACDTNAVGVELHVGQIFYSRRRWSNSPVASLRAQHVWVCSLWSYVSPFHKPWHCTYKLISLLPSIHSSRDCSLRFGMLLCLSSIQGSCILPPLPQSAVTMNSLRSQMYCCVLLKDMKEVIACIQSLHQ